jgi:hypothetical protein
MNRQQRRNFAARPVQRDLSLALPESAPPERPHDPVADFSPLLGSRHRRAARTTEA